MNDAIRRHPDGSIDFDFYRADAAALRRQAMRDAAGLRKATAGVLAATACMLGLAVLLGSSPRPDASLVADRAAASHPIR